MVHCLLQQYPRFWPTCVGESVHYGPLSVRLTQEEETSMMTTKVFQICKVGSSLCASIIIKSKTCHPYVKTHWYLSYMHINVLLLCLLYVRVYLLYMHVVHQYLLVYICMV